MIRFGVLGAGRIGKVHARIIAASGKAKVAYLADAMPKAAADLAAEVGATVASVEDIIKAKDVDAILIATPTGTHADLIEAASNAGKPALCEKPVSLSVERIVSCLKTVDKNKSVLMIGFNRRFDPNFAALEQRIRKGDIGEVELVTIISRDPAPPPADYVKGSGGLYRDMMIHDFDMARFLVGEEFVTVHALGASLVDKAIGAAGDVDTASVQMQTASGKIAVITNSRRATYGYDQRMEVHGSKGMLRAGNVHNTTVELANGHGFLGDPVLNFFTERYGQAYANEVNTFIAAIADGKSPRPNGFDGLQAQKLADAATESWQSGKVVKVQ
ncbi:MAG: inositol 2-dehydrogenase [Rhizobiales bacterium]|nr:inositol 2-dehydrogenase [Hyphomicrobiales bacterium]MBI3672084.1 inositol 2-dehydrogenase [Hyphomicrobiales bacterium]